MWIKYFAVGIDVLLLVTGGLAWILGKVNANASLKKIGTLLLTAWIVTDVVLSVIVFLLGGYKFN